MHSIARNLKHITRQSFNCNFDINKARLKIGSTVNFQHDQDLLHHFIDTFGKYGLVLLECDNDTTNPDQALEHNMLNLQYLFGTIAHYDKQIDSRGFVHIDSRAPNATIDKATETFPVHTDGTYKQTPEKIQSLGCVIPAQPSGGGQSIFISGEYLMEYIFELCQENDMYLEGLKILFNHDCMVMGRALIGEQHRQAEKAVLKHSEFILGNESRKIMELCFPPTGQILRMDSNESLRKLWSKIEDFVLDPSNQLRYQLQPNEINVADNYSILHSRTAFGETEVRVMKRMNFENDDNGALYQCLQNGISNNIYRIFGQLML